MKCWSDNDVANLSVAAEADGRRERRQSVEDEKSDGQKVDSGQKLQRQPRAAGHWREQGDFFSLDTSLLNYYGLKTYS